MLSEESTSETFPHYWTPQVGAVSVSLPWGWTEGRSLEKGCQLHLWVTWGGPGGPCAVFFSPLDHPSHVEIKEPGPENSLALTAWFEGSGDYGRSVETNPFLFHWSELNNIESALNYSLDNSALTVTHYCWKLARISWRCRMWIVHKLCWRLFENLLEDFFRSV